MTGFLNPNEVLKKLNLGKDMVAVDFGCGSGGWAIPLAKILTEGKVYAMDILEESLSALRAKIKIEKLFNIEIRKADVEKGTTILANSCDLVLMTNLLFECEDKKSVLEEGKRVLKKGGKILIVDWKEESALGPKEGKVPASEVKNLAEELDLKVEKEFQAGTYHYGLILSKPL